MNKRRLSVHWIAVVFFASGCGGSDPLGDADARSGANDGSVSSSDGSTTNEDGSMSSMDSGSCGSLTVTCASAGATCGLIGNGCGGVINCGTCEAPATCGGGGALFQCGGSSGCVAKTCTDLGIACGPASDGCGGLLSCGDCTGGQTCGGGGVAFQCGSGGGSDGGVCAPKTCNDLGFNCGPAGDGCGNVIQCGTCGGSDSCGGGGTAGRCGRPPCTPRTCGQAGATCGAVGDGCGGIIQCGTCNPPEICGGAGVANACGNMPGGACTNLCLQQMVCDGGVKTSLSGVVVAPTDPTKGYGDPDPLYNALVYVPNGTVEAFTPGASCNQCSTQASGSPLVSTTSGTDGTFMLRNVPCGNNIPLVIQLGRWRRQVTIPSVSCCQNNSLTLEQTRLPRNKSEGDIPLIAISTGSADPIECVLPKIGIDLAEFTLPSGNGRVHIYKDNGANMGASTPSASTLWGDVNTLSRYDMVILDCVGSRKDKTTQARDNIQAYADRGGRVFASHFSYVWLYNTDPWGCGNQCSTPGMTTASWDVDNGSYSSLTAVMDTTFAKGVAFSQWLTNVGATSTPGEITVQDGRRDTTAVFNPPTQQFMFSKPITNRRGVVTRPAFPLEFTFNTPVNASVENQCGRVLFSDFHVNTGGSGTGLFPNECGNATPLTAQERVLEFMLFDLGACIAPDRPTCTPRTCSQQGFGCGLQGDGCGNVIDCGTCPTGSCGGGGTPGQCGGACQPRSCGQQGIGCGPAGDGCGNVIDCGTCTDPQTCGGGGTPGQCGTSTGGGCTGQTCMQQGIGCGPAGDGCGNVIDCGPCVTGTCGGGGVSGQCGGSTCTPRTCMSANANCGVIGDGCGGTVDCGTCTAPQTCGGGGVANQCGSVIIF